MSFLADIDCQIIIILLSSTCLCLLHGQTEQAWCSWYMHGTGSGVTDAGYNTTRASIKHLVRMSQCWACLSDWQTMPTWCSWYIYGTRSGVTDVGHNSTRPSIVAPGQVCKDKLMLSLFVGLANYASLHAVGTFIAQVAVLQTLGTTAPESGLQHLGRMNQCWACLWDWQTMQAWMQLVHSCQML
jgi:hypothetical protein